MTLPDDDSCIERVLGCCPECGSDEATHLGALGMRDHFRCRDCGGDWYETNLGRAQAAYEDACDSARKHRTEEGF